jgi:phosphoglucosamine mutase|tara:strand:- start:1047 stop:2390 length:1344 start_codon:yes stop_codon:yes gene_type:complete
MKKRYFGTDGVRGIANNSPITADIAQKIGIATGLYLSNEAHQKRVVIAKDTRLSGYMLESALTSGFTSVGMDVFLLGPMPTPAVSLLTKALRADLGVMISASHNTYEYNGIKIFGSTGYKLNDSEEIEIENIIQNIEQLDISTKGIGKAKRIDDAQARYIEYVKGTIDRKLTFEGMKVVVDSANGAGYKVAPQALWELGAEVVSIGDKPNGLNINHEYGSTSLKNIVDRVKKDKADIGIALDGDADRVIIIDEKGDIINGDSLLAIIASEWQSLGKLLNNGVVTTTMSNIGLEEYFEEKKINLIRTDIGDRYVVEYMKEHGYNIGGEQSGHIIIGDYSTTGDGLLTAIQVLAIMKKYKKKISELSDQMKVVPQILKNFKYDKAKNIDPLDIEEINKIGQLKIGNLGRILVRLSGTEPLIRVMGESRDKKHLNKTIDDIMQIIKKKFN